MASTVPRSLVEITYAASAQDYLRSLPLEHFMESTAQATQRKITLESLDLVHARRPEVQVFNELLVQYPVRGQREPGKVVPDNMVVIHEQPIDANGSYDVPLQPVGPYWVLEYVSKRSKRKDYEDNFDKYEKRLKVPYFLLFYPDTQDLSLYRHTGKKYSSVLPNEQGRLPIPELELELSLVDGWVRYWFRGELLPLPADLLQELEQVRGQLEVERKRADEQQTRADEQQRRADEQQRRADEQQRQAQDQEQRARELQRQLEEERQSHERMQRELEQLRDQVRHMQGQPPQIE